MFITWVWKRRYAKSFVFWWWWLFFSCMWQWNFRWTNQIATRLFENRRINSWVLTRNYKDPYGWDGELYKNKLFKKIRPIIPYCKVSILWDKDGVLDYKDAPTDKGKETLLKLLDNKVEITMEDITLEGTYYV